MREVAAAIIAGAALIAAAIYFQPRSEIGRFQMRDNGTPFRLDTKTGEIVLCTIDGCKTFAPPEDFFTAIERPNATERTPPAN